MTNLTAASAALLKKIASGDNYGDCDAPLFYFAPGDLTAAERGNLTDLKVKGLVLWTEEDDDYPGNYFIKLSDEALQIASH